MPVDEARTRRRLLPPRDRARRLPGERRRAVFFHSHDEPALAGFQSGIYYVDGTKKESELCQRPARTQHVPMSSEAQGGQYVAYTFFKADPAWRRLPVEERDRQGCVRRGGRELERPFRAPARLLDRGRSPRRRLLWKITPRYEDLGELGAALNGTPLAGWLGDRCDRTATTKASQGYRRRAHGRSCPRTSPTSSSIRSRRCGRAS